jgi:hypothetical protein
VGEADVIWVNDAINGPLASTFPMRQSERLQHVGFKLLVTL